MSTFDDFKNKADDIVDKAKSTVSDLADQGGDMLADAVDKISDTVDERTGGSASAVAAKMDETVAKGLAAGESVAGAVVKKATDASRSVKDTVKRKPD